MSSKILNTYTVSWTPDTYVQTNVASGYQVSLYTSPTNTSYTQYTANGAGSLLINATQTSYIFSTFTFANYYYATIYASNALGLSDTHLTTTPVQFGRVPFYPPRSATATTWSDTSGTLLGFHWTAPISNSPPMYSLLQNYYLQVIDSSGVIFDSAGVATSVLSYRTASSKRPVIGKSYSITVGSSNVIGMANTTTSGSTGIYGTIPGQVTQDYVSFSTGTTTYLSYISTGWIPPVDHYYDTVSMNYVQFFTNPTDFTLSRTSATPSFDRLYQTVGSNTNSIRPTIGNYYAAAIVTSNIIGTGISTFTNTTRFGTVPALNNSISLYWNTGFFTYILSQWAAPTDHTYDTASGYYVSFFSNFTDFTLTSPSQQYNRFDFYKFTDITKVSQNTALPTIGYYYAGAINSYNIIGSGPSTFSGRAVQFGNIPPAVTNYFISWDPSNPTTYVIAYFTLSTDLNYNTASAYYTQFYGNSTQVNLVSGNTNGAVTFGAVSNTPTANLNSFTTGGVTYAAQYSGLPVLGNWYGAAISSSNIIGNSISNYTSMVRYGKVPGVTTCNYVSFSTATASYLAYISTGWIPPVNHTYDTVSQNYVQFFSNVADFTLSPTSATPPFDQQYTTSGSNINSITPTVGNYYAAAVVTSNIIGQGLSSFTNTTRYGTLPGQATCNYVSFSTGTASYFSYLSTGWIPPVNNTYDTVSQNYVQFFSNVTDFTLSPTSVIASFDQQYATSGSNINSITPTIGNYYAAVILTSNAMGVRSSFTNTIRYGIVPSANIILAIVYRPSSYPTSLFASWLEPGIAYYKASSGYYLTLFSNVTSFTLSQNSVGFTPFATVNTTNQSYLSPQPTIGYYYAGAITGCNAMGIGTLSSFSGTIRYGSAPAITPITVAWDTSYPTSIYSSWTAPTDSKYNTVSGYYVSFFSYPTSFTLVYQTSAPCLPFDIYQNTTNTNYSSKQPTLGNWYAATFNAYNLIGCNVSSFSGSAVRYGTVPGQVVKNYVSFSTGTASYLSYISTGWLPPVNNTYDTVSQNYVQFFSNVTDFTLSPTSVIASFDQQYATSGSNKNSITPTIGNYYAAAIVTSNNIGRGVSSFTNTVRYGTLPAILTFKTTSFVNLTAIVVTQANPPLDSTYNTFTRMYLQLFSNETMFTLSPTAGIAAFDTPQSFNAAFTANSVAIATIGNYYAAAIVASNVIGTTSSFTLASRYGGVPPASAAVQLARLEWLGTTAYITVYFTPGVITTSLYNRVTLYNITVISGATSTSYTIPIASIGTGYIPPYSFSGGITTSYSYYNLVSLTIGSSYSVEIMSGNPVGYTTKVTTSAVTYGSVPASFTVTAPIIQVSSLTIKITWTTPTDSAYNRVASFSITLYYNAANTAGSGTQVGTTQTAIASATSLTYTILLSQLIIGNYYSATVGAMNGAGTTSITSSTTRYGEAPATFTVNTPAVTFTGITVTWTTPTDSTNNTVATYSIKFYYNAANTAGSGGTLVGSAQTAIASATTLTYTIQSTNAGATGYYYSAVIDATNAIGLTTRTSATYYYLAPLPGSFTVNTPTVTTTDITVTWATPTNFTSYTTASYSIKFYYNAANTAGSGGTLVGSAQTAIASATSLTYMISDPNAGPNRYYYSAVIDATTSRGTTTITSATVFYIAPAVITLSSVTFDGTTVSVSWTCSVTLAAGDYYKIYFSKPSATINNNQTTTFTFNPTVPGYQYTVIVSAVVSSIEGASKKINFIYVSAYSLVTYTVPSNAISATVTLNGAGGGTPLVDWYTNASGGSGSRITGPVTPGVTYRFAGGYSGSANPGYQGTDPAGYSGGSAVSKNGGGGYSHIKTVDVNGNETLLYLAGGGGGGGNTTNPMGAGTNAVIVSGRGGAGGQGGFAGGGISLTRWNGGGGGPGGGAGGAGGTVVATGKKVSRNVIGFIEVNAKNDGAAGSMFKGGGGGQSDYSTAHAQGGGGGGGYFGGGGGGCIIGREQYTQFLWRTVSGGGGGGSDYINPANTTGVTQSPGGGSGAGIDGYVYIVSYF